MRTFLSAALAAAALSIAGAGTGAGAETAKDQSRVEAMLMDYSRALGTLASCPDGPDAFGTALYGEYIVRWLFPEELGKDLADRDIYRESLTSSALAEFEKAKRSGTCPDWTVRKLKWDEQVAISERIVKSTSD